MPYVGQKPADIISTAVDTVTGKFSGEVDAASLDISGNIDVDGTTNLDVVDIDGAVDMASTLTVGNNLITNGNVLRGVNDSSNTFSGGTASNSGANITVYGPSHASLANVTKFRASATETMRIDATGAVTKPLQPAFLAIPSSAQLNLALNAFTTIVFGTEVFDQNSDFASNTFTAPVTGKYQLNASVYLQSVDASTGFYQLYITTSNRDHLAIFSGNELAADPAYKNLSLSVLTDMDAGDTAIVRMQLAAGGNAQADVSVQARFSGYLVA